MPCQRCAGSEIPGMVLVERGADPSGRPYTMWAPCPAGCVGGILSCCEGALGGAADVTNAPQEPEHG
jgi:hypothetical protein